MRRSYLSSVIGLALQLLARFETRHGQEARRRHPIRARNEKLVPFPLSRVSDVLADFDSYPDWWPQDFELRVEQEADGPVVFLWAGCVIGWKRRESTNDSIRFSYCKAPHEGGGVFRLLRAGEATHVTLDVEIIPRSALLALLYRLLRVHRRHTRDIDRVLEHLASFIAEG